MLVISPCAALCVTANACALGDVGSLAPQYDVCPSIGKFTVSVNDCLGHELNVSLGCIVHNGECAYNLAVLPRATLCVTTNARALGDVGPPLRGLSLN